ncbi:LacI family DNA-binding transcriptional regulator [Clostridium sp. Marseille-P2415]|uniref:LacI family DNA-binding transcriptional regulator n=1 Tax=Clostridium sp. Marseille-P2415 TaxID=1805471 RepID=UPI00098874F1|nr:LacI family DNA-binding transcriptional regulator [Clostridium sp. Marseille-P2415]
MSTIKEVAKLAGVSPSTVSRTLSNRIFVEEETRQKVLKAVEELNYKPSIMAKALREGKTYTIALLVPDINSLFYPMIMKSIEKYAAQKGYSIILYNNNEDIECEKRNMEMLGSRGIDGVLCMSVEDDIRHLVHFQKENKVPVVLVNRNFTEDISCITVDNEYGGYLMTKYLLDMGHRKIAGMFGDFSRQRFRERYNGCKKAMEEYGIENYKKYFIYDVNTIEEAYKCTQDVLSREDRPTAFFASLDILAIGIYSGIIESGLVIPQDVSVVGFDNIFMTQYMTPSLTTYNAPIDRLAQQCVECLTGQIENGKAAVRMILKGELIERKSVCPLPAGE